MTAVVAAAPAARADWSAAEGISTAGAKSLWPDVAMTAGGVTVAGWYNTHDASTEIVRRSSSAGAFSDPLVVSVPGEFGGDPKIGVDAAGNAVVGFTGGRFGGPDEENGVKAAIVGHDGALRWRGTVGPSYTGSVDYVDAGMDLAGNAIVFWREVNAPGLRFAARPAGGAFRPLEAIPNPAADSVTRPEYAVAGNGDAVVAWASNQRVWASVGSSTGGFAPATEISAPAPGSTLAPRLAMAPDGAAVAAWVWRGSDYGHGFVQAAYRPAGGAFGSPQTLAEVFYTGVYDVGVAMSPAGEAAVGWGGGTYNPDRSWAQTIVRRPPGAAATFGAPTQGPDVQTDETPRLAYDAAGNLYTATSLYYDRGEALGNAWGGVLTAGADTFAPPAQLSEDGLNVWEPQLAAGPAGEATVVWPRGTYPSMFEIEVSTHTGSSGPPNPGPVAPGPADPSLIDPTPRSPEPHPQPTVQTPTPSPNPAPGPGDTAQGQTSPKPLATAKEAIRRALDRLNERKPWTLLAQIRRRRADVPVMFPTAGTVELRAIARLPKGDRRIVIRGRLTRGEGGRGTLALHLTRAGRRLVVRADGRLPQIRWAGAFQPR